MNTAVQSINLADYIQSGEGGTAIAYTHKDGKSLAKLYNPGFEADTAREEFFTACNVFEMGIPTPRPFRLVTDGVRVGAEYELIKDKRSFARIISQEPGRLEELSLELARMARLLHAQKADPKKFHNVKDVLRHFYRDQDFVPDYFKRRALEFIDSTPDSTNCLHGDLQLGNIITDGKRTLWIDVGAFGYGIPEWDLAFTHNLSHALNSQMSQHLFHVQPEVILAHWNLFFPAYLGTTDPQRIEAAERHLYPFIAARLPYMIVLARHTRIPDILAEKLILSFDGAAPPRYKEGATL